MPIIFVAFQAGGQVVLSQFLGYPEIPAMVSTNVYPGLMIEKIAWRQMADRRSSGTAEWVRRLVTVISLEVGVIVGGFLTKSDKEVGCNDLDWNSVEVGDCCRVVLVGAGRALTEE